MKKTNKFMVVPAIVAMILISNIVFGLGTSANQQYSDVLIVQIGDDSIVEETSSILFDSIQNQNDKRNQIYENEMGDLTSVQNMVTSSQKMSVEQIAFENRLINTRLIIVSIEELSEGILENYESPILFIVSHGSEEGIITQTDSMVWEDLSEIIADEKSAFNFIASCYSANGLQDLENTYGFNEEIDNIVAAYLGLAYLFAALGEKAIAENYYGEAFIRSIEVQLSPEQYKSLGMIDIEYLAAFTNIMVWLLGLVITTGLVSTMAKNVQKAIIMTYEAFGGVRAIKGLVDAAIKLYNGDINVLTFFYEFARFLVRVCIILNKISPWYQVILITGASAIAGNPAVMPIKVGVAVCTLLLVVRRIVLDMNDNDSYAHW